MKNKKLNDIFMYALGALVVFGLFGLVYILLYVPIPPENQKILWVIVGTLTSAFMLVVGYFFGSSRGSKEKTEILNQNGK